MGVGNLDLTTGPNTCLACGFKSVLINRPGRVLRVNRNRFKVQDPRVLHPYVALPL